jgi:hypothetical protein
MFSPVFHPPAFLRQVVGTEPFADYCRQRGLPRGAGRDLSRWRQLLSRLPPDEQARIELELTEVHALSGRDGNAHLLAAGGDTLPLTVPGGPALALWFLVRRPDVFAAVALHHEVRAVRSWRSARVEPGLPIEGVSGREGQLAERLRAFFSLRAAPGPFCAVEAHRFDDTLCLTAYVADRLRLVESFTDGGRRSLARLRPAMTAVFTYRPADGAVRLRSPLRSPDRILSLLQCFTEEVLGQSVRRLETLYHLDRLKAPFRPLPDTADMEFARLKALHLRYPARLRWRQVKLETLRSDGPTAIEELLAVHAGVDVSIDDLYVSYAELQVRLRERRGSRDHLVRLWPDRCSLGPTPLHDRFRRCLRQWGLSDHD